MGKLNFSITKQCVRRAGRKPKSRYKLSLFFSFRIIVGLLFFDILCCALAFEDQDKVNSDIISRHHFGRNMIYSRRARLKRHTFRNRKQCSILRQLTNFDKEQSSTESRYEENVNDVRRGTLSYTKIIMGYSFKTKASSGSRKTSTGQKSAVLSQQRPRFLFHGEGWHQKTKYTAHISWEKLS